VVTRELDYMNQIYLVVPKVIFVARVIIDQPHNVSNHIHLIFLSKANYPPYRQEYRAKIFMLPLYSLHISFIGIRAQKLVQIYTNLVVLTQKLKNGGLCLDYLF
jgi:hypothetical protein